MKIIIAAEIFSPDIGGPATYSKILAEDLIKLGWQVKLICYSNKIESKDEYNFSVIRILRGQNTLKRYVKYFWYLLKLASQNCDLVYAQGPISSGLPAIIVGFLLNKKVVVKITGDYAWEQARNLGQTEIGIDEFQKQNLSGKVGWLKKIEKWVCQNAVKVIVPSRYLKGIVGGWGIPVEKIKVIYNCFVIPKYTFSDYNPNVNRIVYAGRLVPWKGLQALIEVFAELKKENDKFELLIIGDGPNRKSLKDLIDNLNLPAGTILVGRVSQESLLTAIHNSMFVLNSGYEGLSHAILEAMFAKASVVASNVGGNPELITDGQNGLLIEYNNKIQLKEAILKLYDNPELRQKFVENSKEVLKKFTLAEMINKTVTVLQAVADKK